MFYNVIPDKLIYKGGKDEVIEILCKVPVPFEDRYQTFIAWCRVVNYRYNKKDYNKLSSCI